MRTVGIDVSGAVADLFATRTDADEVRTAKVLTTPADRVEGVVAAIEEAGIVSNDISLLVHGTTAATNALIGWDLPNSAMITTEGFRDVIEIGRMHREHLYRPYQVRAEPLSRRRFWYVIDERVSACVDVEASGQSKAVGRGSVVNSRDAQFGAFSEMGDAALARGPVR
jgi:N-methylhydantoinase A